MLKEGKRKEFPVRRRKISKKISSKGVGAVNISNQVNNRFQLIIQRESTDLLTVESLQIFDHFLQNLYFFLNISILQQHTLYFSN